MLKFYLTTIIIYAIIILSTAKILSPMINQNGWLESPKYEFDMSKNLVLFCISAIPLSLMDYCSHGVHKPGGDSDA